MVKRKLHPTQVKLLNLLSKNITDPLSVRELQELVGASSTSVVSHHLNQLERRGNIKRDSNNPRNYIIIGNQPETPIAYLNLYGLAQCGPNGSILDGNPIDKLSISSKLIKFPILEAFIVKAKGDSMEPKIFEGDLLISRKTREVENGMVYICVNDGKALVKRVLKDKDRIVLLSYNDRYPPFIASRDFRVEGIVKGIISSNI